MLEDKHSQHIAPSSAERMKTNEELQIPLNGSNGSQEFIFDGSLLARIARRRRRIWTVFGIALLLLSAFIAFFIFPQNYSASVSISMQKPDTAASPLAALTGGGSKKYLGVLRSRNFAEKVDKIVHFRQVMNLPDTPRDQEDAIDKVMKDLKLEDNASDGLLYITVNLSGPAPLMPDPGGKRKAELRDAVTRAANAYKDVLQDYLKNTDTDKELSLLRAADSQVQQAQASYTNSIDALGDFISHSKVIAIPSSSAAGSATSDTAGGGSHLASLYTRKSEIEAKIKSSEALTEGTKTLLTDSNQNLDALPEEDPLLINARRQVNEAEANLESLQITFGSSMQSVRRAQERLKLAQAQLHKEVETILRGKTTEKLKLQALQAEYETVERQINAAEMNFKSSRNMTVALEKRRNDVMLKLETLKAILTRYAELKIQTVSAQNRMVVIDEARPPRSGKPGMGMLTVVCLFVPFFFIGFWWVIEYLIHTQTKSLS